jgi:uncharacterized membrane protein (DUF373 family)
MSDEAEAPAPEHPRLSDYWRTATLYGRFEMAVSVLVVGVLGVLIVVLSGQLIYLVIDAIPNTTAELGVAEGKAIFALVLTILIALEFNRSIMESLTTPRVIVQSRAIILIAILTVVRKLILLDVTETTGFTMVGLAALLVALGALYWIVTLERG